MDRRNRLELATNTKSEAIALGHRFTVISIFKICYWTAVATVSRWQTLRQWILADRDFEQYVCKTNLNAWRYYCTSPVLRILWTRTDNFKWRLICNYSETTPAQPPSSSEQRKSVWRKKWVQKFTLQVSVDKNVSLTASFISIGHSNKNTRTGRIQIPTADGDYKHWHIPTWPAKKIRVFAFTAIMRKLPIDMTRKLAASVIRNARFSVNVGLVNHWQFLPSHLQVIY